MHKKYTVLLSASSKFSMSTCRVTEDVFATSNSCQLQLTTIQNIILLFPLKCHFRNFDNNVARDKNSSTTLFLPKVLRHVFFFFI